MSGFKLRFNPGFNAFQVSYCQVIISEAMETSRIVAIETVLSER